MNSSSRAPTSVLRQAKNFFLFQTIKQSTLNKIQRVCNVLLDKSSIANIHGKMEGHALVCLQFP